MNWCALGGTVKLWKIHNACIVFKNRTKFIFEGGHSCPVEFSFDFYGVIGISNNY